MIETKILLENIANALVSDTESMFVEEKTDEMGVLLTLHVAKEDMGKVIGKNGDTAKAIRTILRVSGAKENARINMKIAEPNE
jgi:predicted RNA-binding protein YlqC (UPF0109 family)